MSTKNVTCLLCEPEGYSKSGFPSSDPYASTTVIFGKPDGKPNTATGETAPAVVEDLLRNLAQLGEIPLDMREMMLQIKHQLHDPIMQAVQEDLQKALGEKSDD